MSQRLSQRADHSQEFCPHLAQISVAQRREPPVEFPSFENQCLASGAAEMILLGDQASYCLSGQYRGCPRFRRVANADPAFIPLHAVAEDAWAGMQPLDLPGVAPFEPLLGEEEQEEDSRKRWAWIGAALVFVSVFLCSGMVATYAGWQWIARNLPARAAGSVDTVSAANAAPTPVVFIVQTATPEPAPGSAPPIAPPAANAPPSFPEAVTPTPIVLALPETGVQLPPAVSGEGAALNSGDAPPFNIDLAIPTRRPTPIFDLPTSTPANGALPTPTDTATPTPMGTPIIVFGPDEPALPKGGCTFIRWNVQNVREVYYENLPMNGQGEREECIRDKDEVYRLLVVLPDGSAQVYTTTVAYLPPTPTITPTPSFTPEPIFTPTWTPQPPTPTPTPNIRYGVVLAPANGSEATCNRGQRCEVGLLMTNSGEASDTLYLSIVQPGAFAAQLCRPDGVCAANDLSVAGVGPGNTAYVMLRVEVPADASPQSTTYGLVASSGGSGRNVVSQQASIVVTAP
ncbi:hypothetical protein [Caldilinea sp.]|uniref:hypothetical protein n=1 Tax=Caldilinea sp. TaxID=2293560 RepID=UPI0021DDBC00|nr:hypothetical protein [Caldilinea sp.]GIV69327.1 MAG: hypothetical protein KatS3mg048_2189 [Caldilinea sp.]